MEEKNKHIDDLFREHLGNYTEMPPAPVWDGLEARLDKDNRHRRAFIWWPLIALLLLGTSVAGYLIWMQSVPSAEQPSSGGAGTNDVRRDNAVAGDNGRSNPEQFTGNWYHSDGAVTSPATNRTTDYNEGLNTGGRDEDVADGSTSRNSKTNNNRNVTGNRVSHKDHNGVNNIEDNVVTADAGNRENSRKRSRNGKGNKQIAGNLPITNNTSLSVQPVKDIKNKADRQSMTAYVQENSGADNKDGATTSNYNGAITNHGTKRPTPGNNQKTQPPTLTDRPPANNTKQASGNNQLIVVKQNNNATENTMTGGGNENKATPKNENADELPKQHKNPVNQDNGKKQVFDKNQDNGKQPVITNANPDNSKQPIVDSNPDNTKKPLVMEGEEDEKAPLVLLNKGSSKKPIVINTATPTPPKAINNEVIQPDNAARKSRTGISVSQYLDEEAEQAIVASTERNAQMDRVDDDEDTEQPLPASGSDNDGDVVVNLNTGSSRNAKVPSGGGGGGGGGGSPIERKNSNNSHFEAGIKLGYERGFNSYTAKKYVASIYGQYDITSKIALMLQPSIKFAGTSTYPSNNYRSYYDIKNGASSGTGTTYLGKDSMSHVGDTIYYYRVSQTYDSIVVKNTARKNYVEIEIPIMMKYQFNPRLALLVGMNVNFGGIISVSSQVQQYTGLVRTADSVEVSTETPPNAATYFSHTGDDYSSYTTLAQNPTTNPVRFGYIMGLSYNFKQRLLFDVVVQQSLSAQNQIPDQNVRKIYNQPYVRVSVGYKLFGKKKAE